MSARILEHPLTADAIAGLEGAGVEPGYPQRAGFADGQRP